MVRMIALALVVAAPNCTDLYSVGTHGFAVPTFTTQNAVGTSSAGAVTVALDLQTHNPNPYPLSVSSVDYAVSLQGVQLFSGTLAGLEVEPAGDGSAHVSGTVPATSPAFAGLSAGQSARYVLSGTLHVDSPAGVPIDVDYSMSGNLTVPALSPSGR